LQDSSHSIKRLTEENLKTIEKSKAFKTSNATTSAPSEEEDVLCYKSKFSKTQESVENESSPFPEIFRSNFSNYRFISNPIYNHSKTIKCTCSSHPDLNGSDDNEFVNQPSPPLHDFNYFYRRQHGDNPATTLEASSSAREENSPKRISPTSETEMMAG